ncbi:oxidoreductase [Neoasaia chiangmaiensis NBRC 101099]|uniref:Aldo/keto reductase n=1 Tax=Neoasaia chiangmaiensis TaxID=320497 RepID=A0A1U9KSK8_9PROT|nr:aldo/keto reductase [Neoasaia chiangmaiensis]AQS88709.1 aldo/keto reductase [Neoasaia chiangmaiensis]GBR40970.1 oxidoreductase [Neoasaia chiangmaiensis NBRC 101099]GEN13665.1 aldo/keto reductase [Neoasaia chiangmaiensis]
MQYRQLGRSGLRISALNFGSVTFGGTGNFAKTGNVDVTEARRMIDICIDHDVNMFDTADAYSGGLAEEITGAALKDRSQEVLVTSKARFRTDDGPNGEGLSRYHLIAACEASLKRLGRDHIDLYYLHEWDGLTPLEESLAALETLRQQGKIRYAGISNFSGWQAMKALSVAERDRLIAPVSQQIYYTLEARDAEYELLPLAVDQGLGVQVWSPLACGLLSGKYRRGVTPPEDSRRIEGWDEPHVRNIEKLYDTVEVLVEIAEAHDCSPARVALAWTMNRPGVTSLVLGARKETQLLDNLAAATLHLKQEEVQRLEDVSALEMIYPHWHQKSTAAARFSAADRVLYDPALRYDKALAKRK